uniref:Uncharacterized protein n=1 Tax=Physcomitrium patens TaxID=3218 RepID=A0A2K1ICM5_PHYPA|nr:hypothetical protein PHYPA_030502 [Physcomitrium patens]
MVLNKCNEHWNSWLGFALGGWKEACAGEFCEVSSVTAWLAYRPLKIRVAL